MLTTDEKSKVIKKFKTHDKDTGSVEVQVGVLSEQINRLQQHLIGHKKDVHSRRGLLKMVNQRRKLLSYIKTVDEKRHEELAKKVGLKKTKAPAKAEVK